MSGDDTLEVVSEIERLLTTREAAPPLELPESLAPPEASPDLRSLVDETAAQVRAALAEGKVSVAVTKLKRIPSHLRRKLGSHFGLLEAYVKYRSGDPEGTVEALEELVRSDEALATRHPAVHYFLARSHDALSQFERAVQHMRVYVLTQAERRARAEPVL